MKASLWILVLLLAAGCYRAPQPPRVAITLTAGQLDDFFYDRDIDGFSLNADARYDIPETDWFRGEFGAQWNHVLGMMSDYTAGANDCDDFARGAAFVAQVVHSKALNRTLDTALAVGEFWYTKANGTDHAIIAAVCRESGTTNLVLEFYEPQPPTGLVKLTKQEQESCFARRF